VAEQGSSGDDEDDPALLARFLDGDSEAFAAIVHRYRDRLWAVALRTTGNPEDAADALQDGLISAMRHAASFRGDARLSTWLHRIVVNACLDRLRRTAARPTVPLPDDDRVPASPRDLYEESDTTSEVYAALATLPVEQRAAIVLVDIEGYPVEEVAAILDVPTGTVKSRCARGRARLMPMLGHLRAPGGNPPADDRVQSQSLATSPGTAAKADPAPASKPATRPRRAKREELP
jgi:RNA polymerase sigma-70 factor (ECF subfamily)